MSSAGLRVTFNHMTLDELVEQLNNLRFAGWGKCPVEFNRAGTAFGDCVEMKMYRNLAGSKEK